MCGQYFCLGCFSVFPDCRKSNISCLIFFLVEKNPIVYLFLPWINLKLARMKFTSEKYTFGNLFKSNIDFLNIFKDNGPLICFESQVTGFCMMASLTGFIRSWKSGKKVPFAQGNMENQGKLGKKNSCGKWSF